MPFTHLHTHSHLCITLGYSFLSHSTRKKLSFTQLFIIFLSFEFLTHILQIEFRIDLSFNFLNRRWIFFHFKMTIFCFRQICSRANCQALEKLVNCIRDWHLLNCESKQWLNRVGSHGFTLPYQVGCVFCVCDLSLSLCVVACYYGLINKPIENTLNACEVQMIAIEQWMHLTTLLAIFIFLVLFLFLDRQSSIRRLISVDMQSRDAAIKH